MTSSSDDKLIEILRKCLNDSATDGDIQELSAYLSGDNQEEIEQLLTKIWHQTAHEPTVVPFGKDIIWQRIEKIAESRNKQSTTFIVKKFTKWTSIAALWLVLITVAFFYVLPTNNKDDKRKAAASQKHTIEPGGNKATLTLSNGHKIELREDQEGVMIMSNEITYTDGTQLIDMGGSTNNPQSVQYSTLSTPVGGQYQIVLPDGTKVWLNAASSLRYPVEFSSEHREVFLEGEAYFEVNIGNNNNNQKVSWPFVVKSNAQEVYVLGTAFNVSSYADEHSTITTLISGRVRIHPVNDIETFAGDVQLVPGSQSILSGTDMQIQKISSNASVAWKSGHFDFNRADLKSIMRQLARWYNINVIYDGDVGNGTYVGKIKRSATLSDVLDILKMSGINFRIDNETVIVETNQ